MACCLFVVVVSVVLLVVVVVMVISCCVPLFNTACVEVSTFVSGSGGTCGNEAHLGWLQANGQWSCLS